MFRVINSHSSLLFKLHSKPSISNRLYFLTKENILGSSCSSGKRLFSTRGTTQQLLNNHQEEHQREGSSILDRRDLSPNEQIMLSPSLKKYGNGLVLRVINIKIEKPFNVEELLRKALDRVQKGQPLLRSRIVRNNGKKLDFAFELMDDQSLPLIPLIDIGKEMSEFEKYQDPIQEYIEKVLTQRSYDLERDFQLELYHYMKGNDLTLIVRYNHCIGDGISVSKFIGQLLRECENVSFGRENEQVAMKRLLPSTDDVVLNSRLNSFSAKLKSLGYAFQLVKEMIFNKPNQALIQFDRRYDHKYVSMNSLEFEGEILNNMKKFTRQHDISINSCLITLISLAYLKAAREHGSNNSKHNSNCIRVGYPTGLSKNSEFSQILDGNTLSVHVGVFIDDLKFDNSDADLKNTVVNHSKQILANHAANFENQYILTNILQSPLNREKAMAKTLENNEIFMAGLPVNFILTNNGLLDDVKRTYHLSSNNLSIHSMYTVANTSALAGCLACGALTLPSDEKHSAKLIISLSCMEPIISKDTLERIKQNLKELFVDLFH